MPLLVVVENNYYAQSTPSQLTLAGSIADRGAAFGIETAELDTTDVAEIWDAAAEIVPKVRSSGRPFYPRPQHVPLQPALEGRRQPRPGRDRDGARSAIRSASRGARLTEDERAQIDEACERRLAEAIAAADASPPAMPEDG